MEFKTVKLKFMKDASEIGTPFKVNKPNYDKNTKVYKEDFENFLELCNSGVSEKILNSRVTSEFYQDSGLEQVFTFDVFNGIPKTFKFLGMDITEDLDAVIKGSVGVVRVGSLINVELFKRILQNEFGKEISDSHIDKISNFFTKDRLKASIENLKFDNLFKLGDNFDKDQKGYKADGVEVFTFLDNIIEEYGELKTSDYRSIILNFINKKIDIKNDSNLDVKLLRKAIYTVVTSFFIGLIERYKNMSRVLSALDLFFDYYKKFYGVEKARQLIKNNIVSGEYGDIGTFDGYSGGKGIEGRTLSCNLSDEFINGIKNTELYNSIKFNRPLSIYATTMYDYPKTFDITNITRNESLAYSVLDGLKYIDRDLELDSSLYDMNNPEERDFFLKNVVTSYKKKFDNFFDGVTKAKIDDEIVNSIIPKEENSVDILNVNKSLINPNVNTDIEITKVSFNKTNLMNACKIIDKICNSLLGQFKDIKVKP